MIRGPRVTFPVAPIPAIAHLEGLVPGVEVHGWTGRWTRLSEMAAPSAYYTASVALHSAWRLEEELRGCGILYGAPLLYETEGVYLDRPSWVAEYGRSIAEAAVARGELRADFLNTVTPYQLVGAALSVTRPWNLKVWRPGSGKTCGALLDIMARPGDALILCPSKARKEWKSGGMASAAKFTHLDIHRVLPSNVRSKADPERKDDYDFEAYRQRMRAEGRRAIVVIGFESLRDHLDKARRLAPEILVIDEIHELGSSDRWAPVAKQDGKTTFKKAATEGGQATMAVAAMEVSQLRSLKLRSGLSGTPLDDGRPRRLWAVLDLLSPGGFGPYSRFKVRYCDYKEVGGYPDDRGASHVDELKARCFPLVHDVSYQESHGALPALRMEVEYVGRDEQNPPDAFTAEFKRLSKLKYSGGSDRKIHGMAREAALAEACSRIRRRVLERVEEFLKGGGKVVILMTRKKMLRAWAERIRKMCPDTWEACGSVDATEDEEKFSPDIDAAVEAYAVHPGPCCLIGTFQAIGTSKDGMQYTDLAVVAQVPEKPGLWIQGRGRFERLRDKNNPFVKGQRSPILWVPIAEGSAAEKEVGRLTRKFGPIEKFTDSPELREQVEKLDGTEGDDLLDSAADKLIRGDVGGED